MSWAGALKRSDGWQARHATVAVPIAVVKKFIEDDAAGLGVQVAYWAFFSVFSLLLAFVSILGFARPRLGFFPFQLVMVSPFLVPVWAAGPLAPFRLVRQQSSRVTDLGRFEPCGMDGERPQHRSGDEMGGRLGPIGRERWG